MVNAAAAFVAERLSYVVVGVFGLAMLVLAGVAADSALHLGMLPFDSNEAGVVTRADGAGDLRRGDVIRRGDMPAAQRFKLFNSVREGSTVELSVERAGAVRHVSVAAVRSDPSALARDTRFVGLVVGFVVVIGLASLVFLTKPHVATLGFYFCALIVLIKSYQSTLTAIAWPFNLAGDLLVQVCYPLAQFLILLFAAQIFAVDDRVTRALLRVNAALGIVVFFGWSIPIFQNTFLVPGLPGQAWWMACSDFLQIFVTLVGLGYVARAARGSRVRVWLVLVGIALPAASDLVWSITAILNAAGVGTPSLLFTIGSWTDDLQPWFGPLGIALVCYGLVLRRIVAFRSALAQTAVATLASVALLALFTLVDWAVEQLTGEHHNDYVTIVTLLISGFLLRLTHHRVEEIVTHVLFKSRLADAKALSEAAAALACTASTATVYDLLLGEPLRILQLPAAALYLAGDHADAFGRAAIRGHADGNWPRAVAAQGVLAARLRAGRRALRVDDAAPGETFAGAAHAVAVPLFLRGELGGIAVYADRTDDARLDDEDLRHVERLGSAAAAALDHVDALESRRLRAVAHA